MLSLIRSRSVRLIFLSLYADRRRRQVARQLQGGGGRGLRARCDNRFTFKSCSSNALYSLTFAGVFTLRLNSGAIFRFVYILYLINFGQAFLLCLQRLTAICYNIIPCVDYLACYCGRLMHCVIFDLAIFSEVNEIN